MKARSAWMKNDMKEDDAELKQIGSKLKEVVVENKLPRRAEAMINIKVDSRAEYESERPGGSTKSSRLENPACLAVKSGSGKRSKCDKLEKGQVKLTSFMEFVTKK